MARCKLKMISKGTLVKVKYVLKVDGAEIENPGEPVVVAVGKGQVMPGFDEAIQNAEVGKQVSTDVPPAKAYGERNADLVRLVPMDVFKRQAIEPVPGMPLELDGMQARVQSVSGGRVRVDFNHPLAGKTINYSFTVVQQLSTSVEKINAITAQYLPKAVVAFDEKAKVISIEVPSGEALKEGYLVAKGRCVATVLNFVDEAEQAKITEVFEKAQVKGQE